MCKSLHVWQSAAVQHIVVVPGASVRSTPAQLASPELDSIGEGVEHLEVTNLQAGLGRKGNNEEHKWRDSRACWAVKLRSHIPSYGLAWARHEPRVAGLPSSAEPVLVHTARSLPHTHSPPSLTLKVGLSIAHCRAQPRDTVSLAFRVRLGSRPKKSVSCLSTAGTRVVPPTTSTLAIWLGSRPASASACSGGAGQEGQAGQGKSERLSASGRTAVV